MKVLLTTLNSKYVHSNLALKYLYSSVENRKVTLDLQEYTINHPEDHVFTEILRKEYDMVCFSCYIWNVEQTVYLAENLKKADPSLVILMGGPEVCHDAYAFLARYPFVDMVISGEGEVPFGQLMDALTAEAHLGSIKGLSFRQEGEIQMNPTAEPPDFETIPFPYLNFSPEADKVVYYESSRGCPFRCSYCLSALDKNVRGLSLERVKSDLSYFIYKRVKQVKFIDRTFNWNKVRCLEIFRYLMDNDNGVTNFHFEMCGDLMDEELLDTLGHARDGLFQFEIGVQSTNTDALAACSRNDNFSRLAENVRALRKRDNIHLHLDLIAGLPYETYDSFRKSFNDVYLLAPHNLQLGFLKVIKGAPIRNEMAEHGFIVREKAPYEIISNKYMSALSLVRLKKIENVLDLYYNRGGFEKTLDFAITHFAESPFDFYEELADYYYLKGFQHKSHKKEDLYRIFLLYAGWKEKYRPNTEAEVQALLKEDMDNTLNPEAVKKFERKGWEIL